MDAVKIALAGDLPSEPLGFENVFLANIGLSLCQCKTSIRVRPLPSRCQALEYAGPGKACKFIIIWRKVKDNPEPQNRK